MSGLEEELQCSVCHEIYIEPAVVACGHMFCKACIEEWSRKSDQCPLCRTRITTIIRITNGNSLIDKAVSFLSVESRERRVAAKRERAQADIPVIPKKRKQDHCPANLRRRVVQMGRSRYSEYSTDNAYRSADNSFRRPHAHRPFLQPHSYRQGRRTDEQSFYLNGNAHPSNGFIYQVGSSFNDLIEGQPENNYFRYRYL